MENHKLTTREEANALTLLVFRNGFVEDLHAGKSSELLKNKELSRITDEEMKKLMIESSAVLAWWLKLKEKDPEDYWTRMHWAHDNHTKTWNTKYEYKPFLLSELRQRAITPDMDEGSS